MRFALMLLAVGCGPITEGPVAVNVEVDNNYTESIFTIDLTTSDGGTVRAMDMDRIADISSDIKDAVLRLNPGDAVSFNASVESLGQTTRFNGSTAVAAGYTLLFTYDFDSATGMFSLHYKWQ